MTLNIKYRDKLCTYMVMNIGFYNNFRSIWAHPRYLYMILVDFCYPMVFVFPNIF